MSNYKKHFQKELSILREQYKGDKLVIDDFIPVINDILDTFSRQGHSGMSASAYAHTLSATIKNVLMFKALSPLTGEDSEWNDVDGKGLYQNNRQSDVFKDIDGAKYNDGIVWRGEEEYDTFTGTVEGIKSSVRVEFPLETKTFYVDVYKDYEVDKYPESEVVEGAGRYVYRIKDRKQLEAVEEYYGKQSW